MSLIDGYNQFKQQLTNDIPEVAQRIFNQSDTFYTITDNTDVDWSLYRHRGKYYLYRDMHGSGVIYVFECTTRPDKNVYYVTEDYTYFCHYSNASSYTETLEVLVFRNDRFKECHEADFVDRFYGPAPNGAVIEPIPRLARQIR